MLEEIRSIQAENVANVRDMEDKIAHACRIHDKVCKPLFDKRADITGSALADDESGSGGIPNFWLTAMEHDTTLIDVLSEGDADVLSYLQDLQTSMLENDEGYKLTFKFAPGNPYFTNQTIERVDSIAVLDLCGRKIQYWTSKATTIKWLKRPDHGGKKKGKKGKSGGKKGNSHAAQEDDEEGGGEACGTTVKLSYEDSFFALFSPPCFEDLAGKGGNKEDLGRLLEQMISKGDTRFERVQEAMAHDRAVAKHIYLDFAPRAGLYYTDCIEDPSYEPPSDQGYSEVMKQRIEKLLDTQQEIDIARRELANSFRTERKVYWNRCEKLVIRRRSIVDTLGAGSEDGGDGGYFWLTCMRNLPELWDVVNDRDELALRYLRDVRFEYSEGREDMTEPIDLDPFVAPPKRAYKISFEFGENPFFSDTLLTVCVKHPKDKLEVQSSPIKWKPNMRMTVRRRDTPEGGGAPLRFRQSFFLLFEQSAGLKSSKPGLWDDIEKARIANLFKGTLLPQASEAYLMDPENDGVVVSSDDEDDPKDDPMDDTDEEEEQASGGSSDSSDLDSEDDDVQTKIEKAQAKKKKRESFADTVLKGRDPCVIFVMFMIAMNVLIVPLSFLMQQ